MNINEFYKNKSLVFEEWWLDECAFPSKCWARLRKFSDGSCDVKFDVKDEDKCYGFEDLESAHHFLQEDEFISFDMYDAEDENQYGVRREDLRPPSWFPPVSKEFEYIGQY